jgi:magnesium transporter
MNEIMKVLTIISTIFIPLSFIASLYGMNFDPDASPWNMPELRWRWGYPATLGLMAAVAAGLLVWFRRRGWLGDPEAARRRRGERAAGGPPEA